MDNITKLKNMLKELTEVKSVEHIKSVESAVTTAWGEEIWDHEKLSRDTLQNAVDGCVESKIDIDQIKITTDNDQIRVHAPNEYSLEKLYYIGSTKSEKEYRQIGAHGEGIKKVFSDLSRMGIFNPILLSGDKALIVTVGKEVPGTELRPLIYNYFQINKLKGNYFILNTIDKKLKKSFQYGLKNFFYSKNPLIGDVLHSYGEITVYKSTEKNGVGFYKGLKRIDIKDIPVIISIDKAYAGLEKRVRIDRDRQQFDAKLQTTFYSIFARSGFYYREMENNPAIKYILKSSKKIWPKGHLLLSQIASNSYGRLKDDKSLKELFGNNEYFSESRWTYSRDISYQEWFNVKTQNWVRNKTAKEKKNKKIILPAYFTSFGVLSALESFIRNRKNAERRIKNKKTKDLTPKEQKCVNFLFEAAKGISPAFTKLFSGDEDDDPLFDIKFKTITCPDILGELKESENFDSKIVYLHKKLFKESFGKIMSVWLHELSHSISGGDSDRSFSDCLTVLISKCIDNNHCINKYMNKWETVKIN